MSGSNSEQLLYGPPTLNNGSQFIGADAVYYYYESPGGNIGVYYHNDMLAEIIIRDPITLSIPGIQNPEIIDPSLLNPAAPPVPPTLTPLPPALPTLTPPTTTPPTTTPPTPPSLVDPTQVTLDQLIANSSALSPGAQAFAMKFIADAYASGGDADVATRLQAAYNASEQFRQRPNTGNSLNTDARDASYYLYGIAAGTDSSPLGFINRLLIEGAPIYEALKFPQGYGQLISLFGQTINSTILIDFGDKLKGFPNLTGNPASPPGGILPAYTGLVDGSGLLASGFTTQPTHQTQLPPTS
jgi:hypothetical protein